LRDSLRAGTNDIAEIIIYNRIVTSTEQTQVEDYLATRYGFTLPPPPREDGLLVWLKADDITGVANGQPVGNWPATSGTSVNATSTGAFRPTFVTNAVNGRPVVRFTGNGGLTKDQPLMVANIETGANVTALVVLANQRQGANPLPDQTVDVVMGTKTDFPSTGFGFSTYNSFASRNGRAIRSEGGQGNNGSTNIRKNGSSNSTGLNAGEYAIATYTLTNVSNSGGSGSPLVIGALRDSLRAGTNDIAEIIIYGRTLTQLELDELEVYLSNRYNIPLVRPAITGIPSSGLQLWLKLDESSQVLREQPADFWLDQSGARNHARSSGAARPVISNNGANNRGFIVMQFDGANDTMGVNFRTSGNLTTFAVLANRRPTINAASPEGFLSFGGLSLAASVGASRQYGASGGTATALKNGGASTGLALNEFAILRSEITGSAASPRIRLGSLANNTGYGQNDVAEILVYDRALSVSEIAQVERYLSLKYGVTVPANTAPQSIVLDLSLIHI
jgi:hypothetical protein